MRFHGTIAVLCGLAGVLLLGVGGLMPAHVRAVDRELLALGGRETPGMADAAVQMLAENHLGTARRLLEAAEPASSPALDTAWERLRQISKAHPEWARWGGQASWLERNLGPGLTNAVTAGQPVLGWALPESSRAALLRGLSASSQPTVMALLACRKIERTEIFPAVGSAAGQPFEAALLIGATLAELGRTHAGLAIDWERAAVASIQGKGSLGLERAMLDLLSAARWLDWDQLANLTDRCEDAASLATLTSMVGPGGREWSPLLAAVVMNPGARGIAANLKRHGPAGMRDLQEALGLGTGAVQMLAREGSRIHHPKARGWLVEHLGLQRLSAWILETTRKGPSLALAVKYLLWLDGVFLVLLAGWHFRRSFIDEADARFEPRPDYRVLGIAAAAACVLVFLTVEQYLVLQRSAPAARGSVMPPLFRARFRAELPPTPTKAMNEKMIAMLVAFFAIQLAIYLTGLARLRHLRGRLVESSVKLKLIDNEEALFDAPLYMGIAGSVLALVLRLTGYEGISLMASYSSTLFGILFCFILKVMHVRPYRQRLILEAAENPPE